MDTEHLIEQALESFHAGNISTTASLAQQVLETDSQHVEALFLLGTVEYMQHNYHRSIALFLEVIRKEPDHIRAHLHLGNALQGIGKYNHSLKHYKHVMHLQPDNHLNYTNIGNVYFKQECYDTAKFYHEKSIAINPYNWISYNNLAGVLKKSEGDDVYDIATRILALPHAEQSLLLAYALLKESWQWDLLQDVQDAMLSVIRRSPVDLRLLDMILLPLNSIPGLDPEEVFEIHRIYGTQLSQRHTDKAFRDYRHARQPTACLRIGYLSPDFRHHTVAHFLREPFLHHDTERFEIYCYSNTLDEDDTTQMFKEAAHRFVNVTQETDAALAQRIYDDGIHILVDLAGHTTGNRLAVMAQRPAPVQMTYLGYANTTGLEAIDYRITDRFAEWSSDHLYTEELLMMPESFLCFGSFREQPIAALLPARRQGYVTFGSCNNITKLTPATVQTWSRILQEVPGSKLLIKSAQADKAIIQRHIVREFARHGMHTDRVELLGFVSQQAEHLAFYNQIDIALDTFPYHGTTTTCEALWMGVPVVTLVGRAHAQRVSYSILKNVGITETIADNIDQYIGIAVDLAHDFQRLETLRQSIPVKIRQSILCNPKRFITQLERLYLEAWERKGFPLK